jgi:signal transduction protein with GAF and PtsI domain
MDQLLRELEPLLEQKPLDQVAVLSACVCGFGADLGTLHLWDAGAQLLRLSAEHALPPPVREKVLAIPLGKGMAGLAAERREPVSVCNLQTDTSGVARPGAKATGMEGSVAIPLLDAAGELRGVLGIASAQPRTWTSDELARCLAVGRRIAERLRG